VDNQFYIFFIAELNNFIFIKIITMKKIMFLLLLQSCFIVSFSQSFKKYAIGESGCSIYLYCDPGKFEMTYSTDSSGVYTGECNNAEIDYGVICVQLKEAVSDISGAEDLMVSYLDYLKTNFKITTTAGYGKGHRLRDREDTRGIIDYWTDAEKTNWKIKSWTDGKFIVVLYACSKKELPETKVNVFLDGLMLPSK
jgi:hypothetical protein